MINTLCLEFIASLLECQFTSVVMQNLSFELQDAGTSCAYTDIQSEAWLSETLSNQLPSSITLTVLNIVFTASNYLYNCSSLASSF